MAEFTKIMEIKKRMCVSIGEDCGNCPLIPQNNGMNMSCHLLLEEHPDKAEEIILKWDKKHPQNQEI